MNSKIFVLSLVTIGVVAPGVFAAPPPPAVAKQQAPSQRDHDSEAVDASRVPTIDSQSAFRPLSHPLIAFQQVNSGGLKVFDQPGALPYVAIGIAALATDKQTEKWFQVAAPGESKPRFSRFFNNFGDGKVVLPACALLYFAGSGESRDTAKLWAVAMANAVVYTQTLKMLTGKARPNQSPDSVSYHGPSTKYDSFPSGHMTIATASAVVLGHQYPRMKLAFYSLAACVGVARIRGGDHWPSDVYLGAGMGYYGGWQAIRHKGDILSWRF